MSFILGSASRALRVAVVGSGPAGFYAAEALLGSGLNVEVDVYDRLPTPFGLVRYGVAPDHASIKRIIARYEKTAALDGFAFFGNVDVGHDVSVEELGRFYDAILFASGAQTDRRLGIPGEDLPGSYTATEFVAWYNGHPDYATRTFDLSGEVAVVIGQGNVAVDVARVLSRPVDELASTDIAAHALECLAESRIREVHVIGRRGPAQAAFSGPELKELGRLTDCRLVVHAADLELNEASRVELEDPSRRDARKNYELLSAATERLAQEDDGPDGGASRRLVIDFFRSPRELVGTSRVDGVLLERNRLVGEPGAQKAQGTGERFLLPCDVFFRSVGYRGVEIPGVPFDETRGVVPNERGRVLSGDGPAAGLYVAGWIKRGPSGVIGTNKPDAIETVGVLLDDLRSLPLCTEPSRDAVRAFLAERNVRVVDYAAWRRIDAAEVKRGEAVGKPREKFVTIEEMLDAAGV